MLFEAGALSKAVTSSRVIPYLLGFEPHELQGPLSQFQAVRADRAGTLRLVSAVNAAGEIPLLPSELLEEAFRIWWPQIEPTIERLAVAKPSNTSAPKRSVESMLGEILELTRARSLLVAESELQPETTGRGFKVASLGERLRTLRVRRGMTQGELARRVNVSQAYLSNIENGRSASPSIQIVVAIAQVLGVNLSDLEGALLEESNTQETA